MNKKRGLSPVIASVLLVSISLILAVIVFFWARDFLGESIVKNGRGIGLECQDVIFEAEAFPQRGNLILRIVNNGNVPIYGFDIKKEQSLGDVRKVEDLTKMILAGQTADLVLDDVQISIGDKITVVPILLGETAEFSKAFVCDDSLGKKITVSES